MVLIRISAGILELETLASWVLKRSLPWFVLQLRVVTYDCMQSDDSLQHDDGEYRRAALKPMAVWRLASGAHFWLRQYACFGRTAKSENKQQLIIVCVPFFFSNPKTVANTLDPKILAKTGLLCSISGQSDRVASRLVSGAWISSEFA